MSQVLLLNGPVLDLPGRREPDTRDAPPGPATGAGAPVGIAAPWHTRRRPARRRDHAPERPRRPRERPPRGRAGRVAAGPCTARPAAAP